LGAKIRTCDKLVQKGYRESDAKSLL